MTNLTTLRVDSDEFKKIDRAVRQKWAMLASATALCAKKRTANGYHWFITYQLGGDYFDAEGYGDGGSDFRVHRVIAR